MRSILRTLPVSLITLVGCGPSSSDHAPATSAPARIVTISGTATETVAALGFENAIVGVDVTSTYPPSVTELPKVGHDRSIRPEGVLSLAPDLVVANSWQLDPTALGQLRAAGGRVVTFPLEYSVDGAKAMIRSLADSLGAPERAAPLIARIDEDLAQVVPLAYRPKVLFVYARGAGALSVSGTGTPMHHMIELAGGRNAMEGFEQFKPLTPEALIAADPDAILLFGTGMDSLQGEDGLLKVPGMAATAAGKNRAFITMEGGLLSNFGPRVGQALAELNARFKALPARS